MVERLPQFAQDVACVGLELHRLEDGAGVGLWVLSEVGLLRLLVLFGIAVFVERLLSLERLGASDALPISRHRDAHV